MSSTAEIAVAVVSWNTRKLLETCLSSLKPDSDAGLADVWVVDNASGDGSAEAVRESFQWAQLIASPENIGFGRAVNEVAARSDAPWIVAANADTAVEPGALRKLLEAGRTDPSAAVLAPRLVLPDKSTQHAVHRFPTPALSLVFNLGLHVLVPGLGERWLIEGHWDPGWARTVDWAHGAFLLIRRRDFDAVGGFDPAQWLYAEDLDLCWRLNRNGKTTRYVPDARVGHELSAATEKAFGAGRMERFMSASYEWMLRRRGRIVTLAFALVNLAGAVVRWAVLAVASRFIPRVADSRNSARRFATAHLHGFGRALR